MMRPCRFTNWDKCPTPVAVADTDNGEAVQVVAGAVGKCKIPVFSSQFSVNLKVLLKTKSLKNEKTLSSIKRPNLIKSIVKPF